MATNWLASIIKHIYLSFIFKSTTNDLILYQVCYSKFKTLSTSEWNFSYPNWIFSDNFNLFSLLNGLEYLAFIKLQISPKKSQLEAKSQNINKFEKY